MTSHQFTGYFKIHQGWNFFFRHLRLRTENNLEEIVPALIQSTVPAFALCDQGETSENFTLIGRHRDANPESPDY